MQNEIDDLAAQMVREMFGGEPNAVVSQRLLDIARRYMEKAVAAALTAQAEEIERLQLRLGSLGANPNMDQDIAGLCVRLGAMYSHRSDGIPTQFVNPDGRDAVAAIEKLSAALKAAQEVKA